MIKSYLKNQKDRIEVSLQELIPQSNDVFSHHVECMRYSLFAGGKRIRPILCLASAEAVGCGDDVMQDLIPIACAIECIHTYSLIHDDLPAMDNDDLRRGKPTSHICFGEANAILAGDGLLTFAFELLTSPTANAAVSAKQRLSITNVVARASGPFGMVGGQCLDIENEHEDFPFTMLQTIHSSKTGALITASVQAGAIAACASRQQLAALAKYGEQVGLAFQIVDDLLNATSTTEKLGKRAGTDSALGKATYPRYFGLDETRSLARKAVDSAIQALSDFDSKAEPLRRIAGYIYTRSH